MEKKEKKISFNERFTDHYRRFINFGKFIDTLKKRVIKLYIIVKKVGCLLPNTIIQFYAGLYLKKNR